ncbi:class A beta-lactamase [Yersinia enterocolitica]|uniref:class A beta-lactamase n=1 Tax=Yersinia enterocolitica TaxID=630 RepID=UPI0009006CEB
MLKGQRCPLYHHSFRAIALTNRGIYMDVLSAVKQENIAASTEIDDLIFMGTPQQWSLQEQKQTFKFMLAAAVLDQSQSQPNLLNKHINYHESDLLSYAPITRKNLAHGMTVSELCAATIQYSDNTAANLLIKELGGLAAVNQFARSIGDQMFRLDRWEPDLNTARPNDPRDTTTPAAMAASMNKLVLGDALRPAQRSQLAVWLKGNTTGDATIRAGAPTDWIVGDKTGSGDYGTTNDIAVLWPTKGAPIVLVVYFTQREKDAKPRRDVLASVTKIILSQIS